MIVPVSAVFAAVLGLLLLVLSGLVSRFRLKYQKSMGVNDDRDFEAAVRAQANLVEYAPLGLVMLAIAWTTMSAFPCLRPFQCPGGQPHREESASLSRSVSRNSLLSSRP